MGYTAYEVIDEHISISRQGSSAEVTILAPFDEAIEFGYVNVGGIRRLFGVPTFIIGAQYTRIPGLFCNNCKIVPNYTYGATDWDVARVMLSFGPLDQQQNNSTEIGDISYDLSGQEFSLPKKQFKVGSASGPVLGDDAPNPVKIVPQGDLKISFKSKPELDPAAWQSFIGKINDSTYHGWAAGTLMFTGVSTKRSVSSDATDIWSYDYMFLQQPNGWNFIWTATGWQELFPHQYEDADFTQLIP